MFDLQLPLSAALHAGTLSTAQTAQQPPADEAGAPSGPAGSTQPTGQPAGGPSPGPLQNPLFFLLFLMVMMYLFVFLGRGKKQKQFDDMLRNLKKNDRVVTIGGIVGTVVATRDDEVVLKVDESTNTKMTFVRKAIQRVLPESDRKT